MRYARWIALATALGTPAAARDDPAAYSKRHRPQFHFSPKSGWIGDPDGLIHDRGKYHLFWWGHAESTDLVHLGIAVVAAEDLHRRSAVTPSVRSVTPEIHVPSRSARVSIGESNNSALSGRPTPPIG